jgi:hypothetical protein
MRRDDDQARLCSGLSTASYAYVIHPQCNEKERGRENPIQSKTHRDLDPVQSSCNQRPAMGTNNYYHTRRQQSRDEPAAVPIEPNLCESAHHSLRNAHWSCRRSSVPTTHKTTPCPPRRTESTHKILSVLHTEIGNRFSPAIEIGYT